MPPTTTTTTLRGEAGFTLVELLIAMGISLIVLLATLQSLDVFTSNAAQQTRQTDANEQVRSVMDSTVADLRGAAALLRASATDLVYYVPDTATTSRIERLCVTAGSRLYATSVVASGTPTAPTSTCGTTGSPIARLATTASTAFTYDGAASSASPALVKDVGLTLSLSFSGGGRTGTTTLKASAARRSAGTLPITPTDLGATCSNTTALLSLSAQIPNVAALSVTYYTTSGLTLGAATGTSVASITLPSTTTTIVAKVTDALGVTNTIQKDVTCAS